MTQSGLLPYAAIFSILLIVVLRWTVNRIFEYLPRIGTGSLTSVALVLAAIYAIAKLGLALSAPHH